MSEKKGFQITPGVARAMLVVNAAVWGSGYTILKFIQASITTQWMMGIRMFFAALLLGLISLPKLRRIHLRRYIIPCIALAVTYWLGFMFQLKGLEGMPPGRNSFLVDTYCVMVPFLIWAITRRRPGWQHIVAAFVCIVGLGFVSLSGTGGAELFHVSFFDGITIMSAVFYALNLVIIGMLGRSYDAVGLIFLEFAFCTVLFVGGAFLTEGMPQASWATPEIIGGFAYLVIGSTIIGQMFQTIAVQKVPTSQASIILSTECIFGVLASMVFYGERLTSHTMVGFALIFGAILLSELQLPKRHAVSSRTDS
ncbi:DMT family transporter [Bifidobacterium simiarum]|nr:DMT family transporter [Bifidobacterium simiarum]